METKKYTLRYLLKEFYELPEDILEQCSGI